MSNTAQFPMAEQAPPGHGLNPWTGMSNDYLNHYNEVIMLLDMLPGMPECAEDIAAWKPKSYVAHFEESGLHWSDFAAQNYDAVCPSFREPFEQTLAELDAFLTEAIPIILPFVRDEHIQRDPSLVLFAVETARSLVGRLDAIIHGAWGRSNDPLDHADAQALADSLF